MTVLFGAPKTYKSTLVLHMAAAITELVPFGDKGHKRVPTKKGSCIYFAAEQSIGRLRYAYEKRVLRKDLPQPGAAKVSWNFMLAKDPWEWQLDQPDGDADFVQLAKDLKPTMLVIDPLIYFHQMDENDPGLVRPLVPLRKAVLSYGGSLVIVHHARKSSGQDARSGDDWSKMRGTSALWGMADAGIMTARAGPGAANITTEFKDFPGSTWTWRPR